MAIAVAIHVAPSLSDGDSATPRIYDQVASVFLASTGERHEPGMYEAPWYYYHTDTDKKLVLKVIVIGIAAISILLGFVARGRKQNSLIYSLGIFASVSAATLVSKIGFLLMVVAFLLTIRR
ncbi:MAG: hypothetical protein OXT49_04875 [Gammaproteobacteria bacterium]|nr:hypothetical protein [Gammaproteobacteria bacterium]